MSISDTPSPSFTVQTNSTDSISSARTQLTEEDWICLSFLTGIGPSRLSRLYTYLDKLNSGLVDQTNNLQGESADLFDSSSMADESQSVISYSLLRSLKWPEVTAREAIAYLDEGHLNEEQTQKRETTFAWLRSENHHVMFQHHPAYPSALKHITVAPTFLYVEGNLNCLANPKMGIVGARQCTGYGREATLQLAEQLSQRGICVVSGGARGVDTAAHQGALNSRKTPTIVVMGTGLLHWYPKQNKAMFESILEQGGALLSEYPLMTDVRAHLFPPRNRIISGLSSGVLVAEASLKSGSLISASYAIQQNREVFALPGRVTDAQADGCHQLIRQGATLVRHVEDIISECPALMEEPQAVSHETLLPSTSETKQDHGQPLAKKESRHESKAIRKKPKKTEQASESDQSVIKNRLTPLPDHLSEWAQRIANLLEKETQALDFDALVRHTELNAQAMMQALMELELSTCIVNYNGRYERC